ncbi:MAG: hypothetical protein LIP23_00325 [Planctomycetes bacterium]|nr:hypothetical protein [Planctomycetota bacterium]
MHADTLKLCPSTNQHTDGLTNTRPIDTSFSFSRDEIQVLRDLAKMVAEHAATPVQKEKIKLWTDHNDLKPTRPVVFCDPENGWNEIITQADLQTADQLARVWEMHLRKELFWAEKMGDDRVTTDWFNVPLDYHDSKWGLEIKRIGGQDGGAYNWEHPLKEYGTDLPNMRHPVITIDYDRSDKALAMAQQVFGDILRVRRFTPWWHSLGMTEDYIALRGLDVFMMDMYDYPDEVHQTMALMRDGTLAKMDYLEKNGLLWPNHEGVYIGSGGFGWTTDLPADGFDPDRVRLKDMWGFCESQETVGVSPDMFEEFVFLYQLPILEKFGLNCYGCCEGLDGRWHVVSKAPNLRRLSVSAWADPVKMAELLGDKYIYSWKPSPTPLSLATFDEDVMRKSIRDQIDLAKAHNCRLEIIMKDNHTLGNNPDNAINWCRIAQEEAARW